jgi:hypothetical protein
MVAEAEKAKLAPMMYSYAAWRMMTGNDRKTIDEVGARVKHLLDEGPAIGY